MDALELDCSDEIVIRIIQAMLGRFGKDRVLLVPRFEEALTEMPLRGRLWAVVVGDDLLVGIDGEGEQLVAIEDLREEKETIH